MGPWDWCMDYCHRQGLSPANSDNWKEANKAYELKYNPNKVVLEKLDKIAKTLDELMRRI